MYLAVGKLAGAGSFRTTGRADMTTHSLNPLKSRDNYFLACKIVTLVVCVPWPLTVVASVMSLAGEFSADTSLVVRVLVRIAWLLALIYPAVFFAIVLLAEKVVAARSYAVAAILALLPVIFTLYVVLKLFST
jgi:hypothetical protein